MRTPLAYFNDPADTELPLDELFEAYAEYLRGRERPARQATVIHYKRDLTYFVRSLEQHGNPRCWAR